MQAVRIILIVGMGFLCVGTVVKKKDPIQLTQTDPITQEEKLKEEAEGKKGPPVPTLELFPKDHFLAEGPVEKAKKVLFEEGSGEDQESEELEGEGFKLPLKADDTWEESWEFDDSEWEEEALP